MLKLTIFSITLLALGSADIAAMRREKLNREIAPYAIVAAAAGFAAVLNFLDVGSIMSGVERILGGLIYG